MPSRDAARWSRYSNSRADEPAVANSGSGDTVSVLETSRGGVLATAAVGQSPIAVAIDGPTHRAFVANIDSRTVSVVSAP